MTEMEKVRAYLEEHNIPHKVVQKIFDDTVWRDQIIVVDDAGKQLWDVICQYGSYGFEEGLLEGMGIPGSDGNLDVEGWLTADEIIKRLEGK